jgi:hypothetical protein
LPGYQRLFRLRKERYRQTEKIQDKKANNAGKHASWEAWFTDPKTWDELGQVRLVLFSHQSCNIKTGYSNDSFFVFFGVRELCKHYLNP